MTADESELRQRVCDIGRRMYERGFVAASDGNISVRLGGGRFLCTPSGVSKGYMSPGMLCVVDGDGKQLDGPAPRTSEVLMHLEIFRQRPDVNAVTHAHPPHATAFAIAGVAPPAGVMPEVEIFLGPVPLAKYAAPGSAALAQSILPHLKDKANTILLANHGVVSFDKDLEQAYFHLETIDSYCRILLLAGQVGQVCKLSNRQIEELLQIKKSLGIDDPRLK